MALLLHVLHKAGIQAEITIDTLATPFPIIK